MTKLFDNTDRTQFRPVLFDASRGDEAEALARLVRDEPALWVHDRIDDQIVELVVSRDPKEEITAAEIADRAEAYVAGRDKQTIGRWVHFPWSRRLVHLLPPDDYRFVRTDRNRYKITNEEQARLRACTIGVAGLSVGVSTAATLALEGVGGAFRLADFDELGLSNLNRLRTGAHNLGVNKAVLAARELFEIDPYLDVEIFPDGITDENIERFLAGNGKLDLLVEECDDLYMKIRLRERARALRMPVIMETSDRGLLDVERFDREPERPLLHGAMRGVAAERLRGLTTRDKVPFVMGILDPQRLSTPFIGSLMEVKRSIHTWPQLASAVTLGGAVATDVARRLLLGKLQESGRYYVDLEEIVADGKGAQTLPPVQLDVPVVDEARKPRGPLPRPVSGAAATPSHDEIQYVVAHAIMAPSGGNVQPWKFRWKSGRLECLVDESHAPSFLDFGRTASVLSLGAAVENAVLAAGAIGWRAEVQPMPDDARPYGCVLTFSRDGAAESPLFAAVTQRVTNRKRNARRPLSEDEATTLRAAAGDARARVQLAFDDDAVRACGRFLGRTDRLIQFSEILHEQFAHELRWTPESVLATRDGVDLATLELPTSDVAVVKMLQSWPALAFVRALNAGRALEENAQKAMAMSAGVALITLRASGMAAYLDGGRVLERVWLAAARRGLSVHPWSGLPYLLLRLDRGGEGLAKFDRDELESIREEYRRVFPIGQDETEIFMFRIGHAGPPTAISLRKPLGHFLTIE